MKFLNRIIVATTHLLFVSTTQAALINLNSIGYVQYGDAQSYSLPIAEIQTGDSMYRISSTPGQIQNFIVIATGSNGTGVNTNFSGMDNAYSMPSGASGGNFFATAGETDPGQVSSFTGDDDDTWDSSLSALMSYLNGDDMVFMFNNNNLNGDNLQSLASWAQITITDNNSTTIGIYDFTNDNGKYGLVSEGGGGTFLGDVTNYISNGSGPDGSTNDDTDYVLSGGAICLDTDPVVPVPVSCTNPLADTSAVNHNLGADTAAYAVLFPELNDQLDTLFSNISLLDLDDYTMSIDFRLGCDGSLFGGTASDEICSGASSGYGKNINNGYEQIFIATAEKESSVQMSEPKSIAIILLLSATLLLFRQKQLNITTSRAKEK